MIGMELKGADQLQYTLNGIMGSLEDMRPAWREVSKVLTTMVKANFASQGARSGQLWPPRVKEVPWPMLRKSDRMYESLTRRTHAEHIEFLSPDRFEWGTKVPYAIYHQTGTGAQRAGRKRVEKKRAPKIGRKVYEMAGQFRGMPPRPPLPALTSEDGEAIADILLTHVLKAGADA